MRPPQPERGGRSGSEVCQWVTWSECEKSCGGRATVFFWYWIRVVGKSRGPTLKRKAALPVL